MSVTVIGAPNINICLNKYHCMDDNLKENIFIKKHSPSGMLRLNKVKDSIDAKILSLDLGCSIGILTIEIAKKSKSVVGIDIRKDSIKIAKKISPKNCSFIVGDATHLPFKKIAFDQIVSSEVIEHIKNYGKYIDEINRVSKKGATLIITTPNRIINFPAIGSIPSPSLTWFIGKITRNQHFLYPYGHYYGGFSPRRLKKILNSKGFLVEKINFCGFGIIKLLDDMVYIMAIKKKTYDDVSWFNKPNKKYFAYYKKFLPLIKQLSKIDEAILRTGVEGYITIVKAKKR